MTQMTCECGGQLWCTHTWSAGQHGQARDYSCLKCRKRHTSVTFLVKNRMATGCGKMAARRILAGLVAIDELRVEERIAAEDREKSQSS